jgi:hypothetical protein
MKLVVERGNKEKLDEAKKYYQRAAAIAAAVFGPGHTKCNQYASCLFICENYATLSS